MLTYIAIGIVIWLLLTKTKYGAALLRHVKIEVNYNGMALMSAIADWENKSINRIHEWPDKKGEIAIVTGGARGIGEYVTKGLVKCGYHVVMAIRNPEAGKRIAKEVKEANLAGSVDVMQLDTSSLKSIERFAKEFKAKYSKLNVLVNNAGTLFGDFRLTEDGFEYQLATNYIGHFYLSHLLMDTLVAGSEQDKQYTRIVNVGSCAHFNTFINFDDIHMKNDYHPTFAYGRSKLAQMMSTSSLSRYLIIKKFPVKIYAAHPGIVASDMFYHSPTTKGFAWMGKFFKTIEEGAVSIIHCAISKKIEHRSGAYVSNCYQGYTTKYCTNKELQNKLVEVTCKMLNIKEFGRLD